MTITVNYNDSTNFSVTTVNTTATVKLKDIDPKELTFNECYRRGTGEFYSLWSSISEKSAEAITSVTVETTYGTLTFSTFTGANYSVQVTQEGASPMLYEELKLTF